MCCNLDRQSPRRDNSNSREPSRRCHSSGAKDLAPALTSSKTRLRLNALICRVRDNASFKKIGAWCVPSNDSFPRQLLVHGPVRPPMKQAMALALLASPLAPSSTAFLTTTPARSFQGRVTQQQQGLAQSSLRPERCSKRRLHATRLHSKPNARKDPAPTAMWTMPSIFTTDGEETAESAPYTEHKKDDSPVGISLIEVAAVAAVAVTIMNYLGPLDSASAAATSSTSAELVAQAGSASVDVGAIFAKVRSASTSMYI